MGVSSETVTYDVQCTKEEEEKESSVHNVDKESKLLYDAVAYDVAENVALGVYDDLPPSKQSGVWGLNDAVAYDVAESVALGVYGSLPGKQSDLSADAYSHLMDHVMPIAYDEYRHRRTQVEEEVKSQPPPPTSSSSSVNRASSSSDYVLPLSRTVVSKEREHRVEQDLKLIQSSTTNAPVA